MNIELLEWDSEFFGIKTGRIVIAENDDFNHCEFLEIAQKECYDLIYVVKLNKIFAWKDVIAAKIELVDIQISMTKKFNKSNYVNCKYEFRRELSNRELLECYTIAEHTSVVSRFYREPLVGPDKTIALYKKWIDNALNNSFSDGIFVERIDNKIEGIHLIRTDNSTGYFTLTGVNRELKGVGLGSKLWNQSYAYWAQESTLTAIKSPFSFQNMESFNFHLKHEFKRIEEIKYVYHYRN